MKNISILITTYNRLEALRFTLTSLKPFYHKGIKILVCNDGSTDGTSDFLRKNYPDIQVLINSSNKGLIYSRNLLMRYVQTAYAISLDDDANFLSPAPLDRITKYFEEKPNCGVIAFRIYWGAGKPVSILGKENPETVKSYVGCGHVWRMTAWNEIPDYPSWYRFYGEENFASFQLFKKGWEVHYLPSVFVHHRVNNKARRKDKDYYLRARRSLRADWFNYFLFYPKYKLVKSLLHSLKAQFYKAYKSKDFGVVKNVWLNLVDVLKYLNSLKKNRNKLTISEYEAWSQLPSAKIYWDPEK
ncbi:glycosyltransferase family 2 protein [uncultured Christiangramia sp.]|uniref:glycosyltransferase family 2 protein n=1 Tax=uncultured Christiangramia sp. TaxID=503836 RepID=UPI002607EF51|nr:glycosyltransferase family 2 protein [uncultured Christiangramia sp.]